jgi:hypothetical protein
MPMMIFDGRWHLGWFLCRLLFSRLDLRSDASVFRAFDFALLILLIY